MMKVICEKMSRLLSVILGSRSRSGVIQVEPVIRHSRPGIDSFCLTTPDFCDRTSWFQNSIVETMYVMRSVGDRLSYTVPFEIIDIDHPSLTFAEKYVRENPEGGFFTGSIPMADGKFYNKSEFRPRVYRNNKECHPSEYVVNFKDGAVLFNKANSPTDVIHITCRRPNEINGGQFVIRPPATRFWAIEHTEMQFTADVAEHMPHLEFEIWGGHPTGDYDFTDPDHFNMFCLYQQVFKGPRDYINIGNDGKGIIRKFSDLKNDVFIFPFMYLNTIAIGNIHPGHMLVRLNVRGSIPFSAEYATLSVYIEDRPLIEYR